MVKKYLDCDVLTAANKRFDYIFNCFEKIVIAFSGGKDSGVMLNLALDYAKEHNFLDKLIVYHLDYEAQYQATTDYVTDTFVNDLKSVEKYWLCLPVKAQCSTSMLQNHWVPWSDAEKEIWVREMPDFDFVINQYNCQFDYCDWDYSVQDNFCKWIADMYKNVCVCVGIRTQESLSRQSAITSKRKINQYDNKNYVISKNNFCVAYPIYDFETEDIWGCNSKFQYKYNKLYDLMYLAGLSIHQMRVASPFNDCAQDSLKLYKVIDPQNWGKMISRVNGVNFTGIYGGTTAMGWKSIKKPSHFTWKEYMYFLLDTLPEETRQLYLKKLDTSIEFWMKKGGVLSDETILELHNNNIDFKTHDNTNYNTTKKPVTFNIYPDELYVSNFKEVPSYKRMCVCIMKNDTTCKYMGFSQTKEEIIKKKEALNKWNNIL